MTEIRLFDFNLFNDTNDTSSDGSGTRRDSNHFVIQMFGMDEQGHSCSVLVQDFKPFFYLKVADHWNDHTKRSFLTLLKKKVGVYYEKSILKCEFVRRKKLYGFDGGKEHLFLYIECNNIQCFNKVKNFWYSSFDVKEERRKLNPDGFFYADTYIQLYEANIPPLLRFFHIQNVSPSGWVSLPDYISETQDGDKKTTCEHEYVVSYSDIVPLPHKETIVPLKICSFDIEASSSHGDFPVPVKSYKKLATNIVDFFTDCTKDVNDALRQIILNAFGYSQSLGNKVDLVYPKKKPTLEQLDTFIEKWLKKPIRSVDVPKEVWTQMTIESMFEKEKEKEMDEEEEGGNQQMYSKSSSEKTIGDILSDKLDRSSKITEINISLQQSFPPLEGDKVTFVGSTFMRLGEKEPYKHHCVVLNTCSDVKDAEIETYTTERDLLVGWKEVMQRENPDIVIGYNIFGFDYEFLFRRAQENDCVEDFLQLSKNNGEICGFRDPVTNKYNIEETSIHIASGQHDLKYIKMPGRIQIDLYNFFRREENLSSYKLDFVAGHFIGDFVCNKMYETNTTTIETTNITGLLVDSYIHFEEIGHSIDYYDNGAKFKVLSIDGKAKTFTIEGCILNDVTKKLRWCLAKDDVTPQDIFRMTNGTADDRAIIAKYCIQDCNLVHYLLNKVDVWTGLSEMANICSVPISFLILRGQGIKLTSYVAKKCREKGVLLPVVEKSEDQDGYEGAIVLEPKCDLYLDNPVACVDYASLYPSSMMSENISHDSKVWTREYDVSNTLLEETGERDEEGRFVYDNLPDHQYVNITYDTFKYVRKTEKSAAEKVKCGYKICRFVQPVNGARAIMPSILEELLLARKTTRKMIPQEKDEFMKNVLDKRQIGYKLTANSLYGQCGAKTSSFYEKDCAAATTATGRLLLTYAKRVVEECYANRICHTEKYGPVLTKAEYIYGDSVASYTPTYIRNKSGKVEFITVEELAKQYGHSRWFYCKEEGKQDKEFCELEDVETWTENGWTSVKRVIRHSLADHKKMIRVATRTGMVDVTDDHSLLDKRGNKLSPKNTYIGDGLLHSPLPVMYRKKQNSMFDDKDTLFCKYDLCVRSFENHLEAAQYCYSLSEWGYLFEIREKQGKIVVQKKENYDEEDERVVSMQEIPYQGFVYDLTTENHHFAAGIGNLIVHNTDSVFFTFHLSTPEGERIKGKKALEITIELAQEAGHLASSFLKGPHDLEYEKTFMPFCLLSKKRYVGMLYEMDPNKCKRKEMGIVLKRRDNAPIVKEVYGSIIDILMKEQDIGKAVTFLRSSLQNLVQEKYPMEKLIISKSLRSGYKNPKQISHKVLADRMTERDPGNKPNPGDRIPYVYFCNKDKKALQGDRIETPAFVIEKGLKLDYSFYISNQIMKPVQQLMALVLEKLWEMQGKRAKIAKFRKEIEAIQKGETDPEKAADKIETLKNKEVKALLFDEFLRDADQSITRFFPINNNAK